MVTATTARDDQQQPTDAVGVPVLILTVVRTADGGCLTVGVPGGLPVRVWGLPGRLGQVAAATVTDALTGP